MDILNLKLDKKDHEELFNIIANIKDSINDIPKLKDKVDAMEKKIAQLNKDLTKLSSSDILKNMANQSSDLYRDELKEMRGRLERLLGDIAKILKEVEELKELKQRVIILEGMMEQKLDHEEFERWKAENDFQKIIQGLMKKFADRNEMIKALKKLEERIMALEEYMREHIGNNAANNALFTTKPLGGLSCASCHKDIINLEGMPAQFHPWARFPQRNPTERIAKVSQGFSKILSMIKPEAVVNRSYHNNYNRIPEESTRIGKDSEKQMAKTHNRGFSMGADLGPYSVHTNDMS